MRGFGGGAARRPPAAWQAAREQLKRDGSERANALGAEVLDRCKFAFRSLARAALCRVRPRVAPSRAPRRRRQVGRKRAVDGGGGGRERGADDCQAGERIRARRARAADRMSAEARLRDVCDHARINRLRNYFDAEDRSDARSVLAAWRLAACAHAAETDLHEVAGRLRHAQAAIREVVDGKSQHEDQNKRQTALSKLLLGVASLHGVRRVKRDRLWSLQLGFRPWVILSLAEHLQRAELLKGDLVKSNQSITTTHMRVESLRSELSQTREKLALAQKRMRDAEGQAKEGRLIAEGGGGEGEERAARQARAREDGGAREGKVQLLIYGAQGEDGCGRDSTRDGKQRDQGLLAKARADADGAWAATSGCMRRMRSL